jgi:hypothetical protein
MNLIKCIKALFTAKKKVAVAVEKTQDAVVEIKDVVAEAIAEVAVPTPKKKKYYAKRKERK